MLKKGNPKPKRHGKPRRSVTGSQDQTLQPVQRGRCAISAANPCRVEVQSCNLTSCDAKSKWTNQQRGDPVIPLPLLTPFPYDQNIFQKTIFGARSHRHTCAPDGPFPEPRSTSELDPCCRNVDPIRELVEYALRV